MWINTKHELPPDEWFFLPGDHKILAIVIGEHVPSTSILYQEFSKFFFQSQILYWQWIDEFPFEVRQKISQIKIDLSKPDLCEDLPEEERTPERIERREKIRKKMVEIDTEELRLKHVRFNNWVDAGKPTDDPREYAEQTGIGLPPQKKIIRKRQ